MKSGFKKFLPALLGVFSGMASAKHIAETREKTKPKEKRSGKSKAGRGGTGFIQKGPRDCGRGTALGNWMRMHENGRTYLPTIGPRPDMAKNWHREFMGKA